MKLGVLTDGISQDLDHALAVMTEFGLGPGRTAICVGQGGRRSGCG